MTGQSSTPQTAGTLFLRLIRPLFDDPTVSHVFYPAVADFQHELHASAGRLGPLVARCRWYWVLARLLLGSPVSLSTLTVGRAERSSGGHSVFVLLAVPLFAGAWWCVQAFMGTAFAAGVL